MQSLRTLLAAALLGGCLAVLPAHAEDSNQPPSAEAVQQSLDGLAERKLADADAKATKASLERTLKLLGARDDSEKQLAELKARLSDAPRQILENQRALARLRAAARSRRPSATPGRTSAAWKCCSTTAPPSWPTGRSS